MLQCKETAKKTQGEIGQRPASCLAPPALHLRVHHRGCGEEPRSTKLVGEDNTSIVRPSRVQWRVCSKPMRKRREGRGLAGRGRERGRAKSGGDLGDEGETRCDCVATCASRRSEGGPRTCLQSSIPRSRAREPLLSNFAMALLSRPYVFPVAFVFMGNSGERKLWRHLLASRFANLDLS